MKFKELSQFFEKIEATASRLTITHVLSDLFKKLHASEIDKTVYLLQGRVVPSYEHIEFGMAEKMVVKSIVSALQLDIGGFTKEYKKLGDLGKTVEGFKKRHHSLHPQDLSIVAVYEELYKLATASGEGSTGRKTSILAGLISALDPTSCRYLVRLPTGAIRLGFSDMTVLDAYSWMLKGDKSLRPVIEKGYHVRPDLGFIGRSLKEHGASALSHIKPGVFTPIIMMRSERVTNAADIVKKIGRCAIESKYDGFRLQVHYEKKTGRVRLYSRSLDDVSHMYPDVIEGIKKEVKAASVIFEGEAIGFDAKNKKFLPFQETVTRKRKYGIEEKSKLVPLKFFAFELLYVDGENYIDKPFSERRSRLEKIITPAGSLYKNTVLLASQEVTDNVKRIDELWKEAIKLGFEGIIAKKLEGNYQAGARGYNWIKLKKSYAESAIEDTIDALVMGYDTGRGKRVGFGLGAFLVGVYDKNKDQFVTVAKIGTGLTDEEWRQLYKEAQKFKVSKKPAVYDVDKGMECDAWVSPHIVVEIRADEITRSPVHTAGRTLKASKSGSATVVDTAGFALRFPRLERFREDRKPEDATSIAEVERLYKLQKK